MRNITLKAQLVNEVAYTQSTSPIGHAIHSMDSNGGTYYLGPQATQFSETEFLNTMSSIGISESELTQISILSIWTNKNQDGISKNGVMSISKGLHGVPHADFDEISVEDFGGALVSDREMKIRENKGEFGCEAEVAAHIASEIMSARLQDSYCPITVKDEEIYRKALGTSGTPVAKRAPTSAEVNLGYHGIYQVKGISDANCLVAVGEFGGVPHSFVLSDYDGYGEVGDEILIRTKLLGKILAFFEEGNVEKDPWESTIEDPNRVTNSKIKQIFSALRNRKNERKELEEYSAKNLSVRFGISTNDCRRAFESADFIQELELSREHKSELLSSINRARHVRSMRMSLGAISLLTGVSFDLVRRAEHGDLWTKQAKECGFTP